MNVWIQKARQDAKYNKHKEQNTDSSKSIIWIVGHPYVFWAGKQAAFRTYSSVTGQGKNLSSFYFLLHTVYIKAPLKAIETTNSLQAPIFSQKENQIQKQICLEQKNVPARRSNAKILAKKSQSAKIHAKTHVNLRVNVATTMFANKIHAILACLVLSPSPAVLIPVILVRANEVFAVINEDIMLEPKR
ncbi:uncharacterized protein LOC143929765 [Lithobates pipiens]